MKDFVKKFKPNLFFRNKHFNTLFRFLFSKVNIQYSRKRITTTDRDFIDLDFAQVSSDKVIVAIHGLEGSSQSAYIKSLGNYANKSNYDFVAVNLRGCSGEPNKSLYSYHSGKTEDLLDVLMYLSKNNSYKKYFLVGYSLGGNMVLKFMGEFANSHASLIQAAVGVSVPCDLKEAAQTIDKNYWLYRKGFLLTLKKKALDKIKVHNTKLIDEKKLKKARTLVGFDNSFTAPANGFKDAFDYYKKNSCKRFIKKINKPSLLISAQDDPFLNKKCYPYNEAKEHRYFKMLLPKWGGHVGFFESFVSSKNYWLERVVTNFFDSF